ncbi:hypothetical protein Amet_3945 [Alkaliphilus metalliredigens QYMF]|uniref:Uncharacterized protein n=1 Tax=Alkaliphilus metalliredigens (strain QYMF) TaxID=293826 RepID=A6TV18_ALKMQ|nr:hypothetical protein [Alkaliphilus metalliredigens]ABR50036.1 hypothetical protein Amet_3945 [Alkaliphilus metalliredigens QYMF]
MLTSKKTSKIMLIKVKHGKYIRLTIPIVLSVIDELIEAFEEVTWVLKPLIFPLKNKVIKWKLDDIVSNISIEDFSVDEIFKLIHELFNEVRKHGRYKMIDVDVGDIKVLVEFY